MKTILFFVLATMMMATVSAFGKETPDDKLEGIVNAPGCVDCQRASAEQDMLTKRAGEGVEFTQSFWGTGQAPPLGYGPGTAVD